MSHTYEKVSSNQAKLSFTIPAEEFDAAMHKAFLKNRNRVSIPGFRKGKAPRKLIETMYGEAIFYDDALEDVFPDAYDAAIKEFDLKPVDRPEVNVDQIGSGQELKFTALVYVRPDVELGKYKGLKVEVEPKHEVTEDEMNARIAQDQQKGARTEDVTDREVQDGDTVNLDYAGTVDGVAFEGGTAQGQTLTIGSHQFIPGFEEQMVGMAIGEEKDLDVTFPEEYHAENLAGKAAVFHVKVNSISHTEMPELDDDFAQDNGFDDLAAYKESIAKELNDRAQQNYDISVENALVEKVVDDATIEVPEAMIEEQTGYILREMEIRMMYQGLRMEDFLKYTGQTREQLAQSYRGEAERRVRTELVLEAIRKAEKIEPTEEEIKAQIADQASRSGQEVEAFEKTLTDEQRGYLADTAAIQKVIDLLKAEAKVTDKKPDEPKEEAPKAKKTSKAKAEKAEKTEKAAPKAKKTAKAKADKAEADEAE